MVNFIPPQRRAQQTYRELSTKDRLLQQQNAVRESMQNRQGGASPRPLREGWKEVKDTKTGSVYYWNKVGADGESPNKAC